MPNIASVLKEEIVRLARKEMRSEMEGLKRASAQFRSEIAALKRRVAVLDKQVARLTKKETRRAAPETIADTTSRVRFSAKGLASKRKRLGLSAADLGALLGVSGQTVYHWEAGKTRPRPQQLAAIAPLRSMGKRQAMARLEELTGR